MAQTLLTNKLHKEINKMPITQNTTGGNKNKQCSLGQ